jgi:uncharacterized protein YdhG (YjbR/CyaY superfamily)
MTDVDAYLAELSEERAEALRSLRVLIREAIPGVQETMAYKMPTFETSGFVCAMAAQKRYLCLYVCDVEIVDRYRAELAHLNLGKGCIRFQRFADLPVETIEALVKDAAAAVE